MNKHSNKSIEKLYNVFSLLPYFWELDSFLCRATENSIYRRLLIEQLNITKGSTVCDVACGTGLNFKLLESVIGEQGKIIGIDNSEKTLELCRKRIRSMKWSNINLVKTDASVFKTETVAEAAICTFAIEIIPLFEETILSIKNAVQKNGRIGFIGFKYSQRRFIRVFNPLWKFSCSIGGGIDMNRNVPDFLRQNFNEVFYKEVFGGFYYLGVYENK
jgi:ubiquinone/menaquinone biosynthesis C-methylase UbiE